jgi:hypothetical protein
MFVLGKLLNPPVHITDDDIDIDYFFSFYVKAEKFRLFLQGMVRTYGYNDLV